MQKKLTDADWKCFVKALADKDFLKISQGAQKQEQAVLNEFMNGNPDLREKLDTIERLLVRFKSSIEKRKDRTIYEIGKLEGYVKCLQAITMDSFINELSMKEFEEAKKHLTCDLDYKAKEIIGLLYHSSGSLNELKNAVKLNDQEFNNIMAVLRVYGILSVTSTEECYSLSETGNRIAKQLKKQI